MALVFHEVTFTYDGAVQPIFAEVSVHFARGWTGIVGANGTGKTTLLRLALGDFDPLQGYIQSSGRIIYCPQRTDDAPPLFGEFMASCDAESCTLKGRLHLGDDWDERWESLSHGERKRAQIAVALWQSPDVLLIDEPTNHIDAEARTLLEQALQAFSGVGMLVSHDRELLDSLCYQCVFLDPPDVIVRPGGYTTGAAQARQEDDFIRTERQYAKQTLQRISDEEQRRKTEASRANRLRSKRNLARNDSDGRAKLDMVRFSGKDGQAGRLARQLDGRVRKAQEHVEQLAVKKKYDLNFWLPGSLSPREHLFTIPAGVLGLDEQRSLAFPELTMFPDDRIAITGLNGMGKSTLLRHILAQLTLPAEKVIYLPQEIDYATTQQIMREVNALSHDQLGLVMTVVSCLGSRPERLLGNVEASPGEIRKILLALGVIRSPHLIIMDEPTNHLDLPAIECLEDALDGCPCGLLLVSHDMRFLSHLAQLHWHLAPSGENPARITLEVTAMD
ncbi:MAG TPA: ATP-binding cassette domain-containing protein [Armatimonadota bacterium]|nr:ATP-binding cassette domain-containing protein [Armatimonadota bacterium]